MLPSISQDISSPNVITGLLVCLSTHWRADTGVEHRVDTKKVLNECLQDNTIFFQLAGVSQPGDDRSRMLGSLSLSVSLRMVLVRSKGRLKPDLSKLFNLFPSFNWVACEHPVKLSAAMLISRMMLSDGPHLLPETTPAPKDS